MITGNENAYPSQLGDPGLTIRQHFAALAMQGILSTMRSTSLTESQLKVIAKESVVAAGLLITELNNPTPAG